MIVVVVLLAVVAATAIVLALLTRSRLIEQRQATEEATATAEETASERDAERERAERAEAERDEASAHAEAAEARAESSHAQAESAVSRAEAAETRATDAETRATDADARADDATTRAAAAEEEAAEAMAHKGLDPELVWVLERTRSDRTWRHSVAVGPDDTPIIPQSEHPLRDALQIEVDAAREEVGAIVVLGVDIPADVTPAGSVLVLRTAQEMLAHTFKAADESELRVTADGDDIVLTVAATDADGATVSLPELDIPPSTDLENEGDSVRVRHAIRTGGTETS